MSAGACPAGTHLPFYDLALDPTKRKKAVELNSSQRSEIELGYSRIASNDGPVGLFAWFVRPISTPTGISLRCFDRECCIATAALVCLNVLPQLAAALVDLDLVMPERLNHISDIWQLNHKQFALLDVVACEDGTDYAILARRELWELDPEQIQDTESYFVSAVDHGKLSEDNVRLRAKELFL